MKSIIEEFADMNAAEAALTRLGIGTLIYIQDLQGLYKVVDDGNDGKEIAMYVSNASSGATYSLSDDVLTITF